MINGKTNYLRELEEILMDIQPTVGAAIANIDDGGGETDVRLMRTHWYKIRQRIQNLIDKIQVEHKEKTEKQKSKPKIDVKDDIEVERDIF